MSLLTSAKAEQEAILTAAGLIIAAVTTSPQTRGVSTISSVLIPGEEKERLAAAMTLGLLQADMIIALPFSISEKNIFFDRS